MADGGRYRRRRHAIYGVSGGVIERKPHEPHYQSLDHNRLNGGIARLFDPVTEEVGANPVITAILQSCDRLFTAAARLPRQDWHVELHQFRIDAASGTVGRPTPEGLHRDGVDWVFVMLVDRRNIAEGVTEIGASDGHPLGRFILTDPGDCVLLDDRRVMHGVTPVTPADPETPAHRDVPVVTFLARQASR